MAQTNEWSLYPGRFQPPHQGHFSIITQSLKAGNKVCILMMDASSMDPERNPFTFEERKKLFQKMFPNEIESGRIKMIEIPPIKEIVYGRAVGYEIRRIHLDPALEAISSTEIRGRL